MIGLPSLGELARSSGGVRIWLAAAPADMRCGFDRLADLARAVTDQDPLSGHLFLFRSRGGDRLKVLYWDTDGYALCYKRLEEGVFRLPRAAGDAKSVELRASELRITCRCTAWRGSSSAAGSRSRVRSRACGAGMWPGSSGPSTT